MTSVLKHAVLPAVLTLGLVGVGLGLGPGRPTASADEKPAAKVKKTEPPRADEKSMVIGGKVLGPDGQPLAAELSLLWLEGKPESLGRTNADGTFRVTVPLKAPGAWLIAKADGHGLDFMMPATNTPAEVTFRLPKDHPVRGRLIDPQGKPVAGATVTATGVTAYGAADSLDRHLKQWTTELYDRGVPPGGDRRMGFDHRETPNGHASRSPLVVKSDADGRFEFTGLGEGRLVNLMIRGPGIADKELVLVNRPGFDPKPHNEAAKANVMRGFTFGGHWQLYGPDTGVVVEPEKVIRGTVTDRETGQPRAGVKVVFSRTNKRDLNHYHNTATTDQDGKYEIRGARKHAEYMVECYADTATGHLPCQGFADDTVGYEPVVIDLKCAKGVVVTGTITDKTTGKPVASQVYLQVLSDNPFVKDYPPFTHSASIMSEQNRVDPEGRFRVVTIPGPTLLMVQPTTNSFRQDYKALKADPNYPQYFHTKFDGLGYYGLNSSYGIVQGCWCKVIDAKPADTLVTQNVELEPATKMSVRVTDRDGKPVSGVHATGVSYQKWANPEHFPETDTLTVYNVEPKQDRLVAVVHAKRKLVGTLTVRDSDADPVVKLGPGGSLTGRLVDAEGKPIGGLTVKLYYAHREVSEVSQTLGGDEFVARSEGQQAVSDANGEFRFDALFPGQEFRLLVSKGRKQLGPEYNEATKHTVTKHGETLQLGDWKITPGTNDGEE